MIGETPLKKHPPQKKHPMQKFKCYLKTLKDEYLEEVASG